jgi:hypothetical protein
MNRIFVVILVLCQTIHTIGQITFSANDTVPPYYGNFSFGMNPGAYFGWTDDQLANISAGNPALGVEGIGVNAFRPTLPEHFLEFWGYDIRADVFQHYTELGMKDNVVFIGFPSPEHKESKSHCPGVRSETFANLYEPIWDNGENGTPVNDENYFAIYLYKMVNIYKDHVTFWEVWNEPDFSFNVHSITPPGTEGSWWDENPDPCDHAFRAPITHYIRMLRIAYEVIKTLDPDAYITTGGLGYPSYLDAIMRNTDNPENGEVSDEFPLKGGAYFDVLSFHSYPHIDNSMREWSNEVNGFVYFRNSDAAVQGVVDLKYEFQEVLETHGYDDKKFPRKKWIITEANIPRNRFHDYIGSEEAQINFLIKTVVACMQNQILQLHPYSLADVGDYRDPKSEFETMGFYRNLNDVPQYEQHMTTAGRAYKTASEMLRGTTFDEARTAKLNLPSNVKGGAFRHQNGEYIYVLWAVTTGDNSERAEAIYSFPESVNIDFVESKKWNGASTKRTGGYSSQNILLKGSPSFFKKAENLPDVKSQLNVFCYPNPFSEYLDVEFELKKAANVTLELYDARGILVSQLQPSVNLTEGIYQYDFRLKNLANGIYFLKLAADERLTFEKIVKVKAF